MALLVSNRLIDESWHHLDDKADSTGTDKNIVSVEQWLRDRDTLIARSDKLGIILMSDQPPGLIEADIKRFDVICLDFPKFTDGRAYSYARLLRDKYGFTGELRAVGNVLRDQLAFMKRCGIDTFEVSDGVDARDWSTAFSEISVRYQEANDNANVARQNNSTSDEEIAGNWSY